MMRRCKGSKAARSAAETTKKPLNRISDEINTGARKRERAAISASVQAMAAAVTAKTDAGPTGSSRGHQVVAKKGMAIQSNDQNIGNPKLCIAGPESGKDRVNGGL